jgi:hypothetical protein
MALPIEIETLFSVSMRSALKISASNSGGDTGAMSVR